MKLDPTATNDQDDNLGSFCGPMYEDQRQNNTL
jgi:hypothetical protein